MYIYQKKGESITLYMYVCLLYTPKRWLRTATSIYTLKHVTPTGGCGSSLLHFRFVCTGEPNCLSLFEFLCHIYSLLELNCVIRKKKLSPTDQISFSQKNKSAFSLLLYYLFSVRLTRDILSGTFSVWGIVNRGACIIRQRVIEHCFEIKSSYWLCC